MSVLVTGGAGYIGSHTVFALLDRGNDVVVLDNLSTGLRGHVGERATFVQGEAGDQALVRDLIAQHGVDSVIHFAGSIVVPESVADPLWYYKNNVVASRDLLEACVAGGVKQFIFSSTATVYAEDAAQPLAEDARKAPISPYARSKLMTEWMLQDISRATDLRHIVLRYFNVCGADPAGRTGQVSRVPTHLIKRASMVALGRIPHLDIFGTDYPTPDGTGGARLHPCHRSRRRPYSGARLPQRGIAVDIVQLRLWARPERAGGRRGGGTRDRCEVARTRGPAPRRRSADADRRPESHPDHPRLGVAARRRGGYHPVGARMGATAKQLTALELARILARTGCVSASEYQHLLHRRNSETGV